MREYVCEREKMTLGNEILLNTTSRRVQERKEREYNGQWLWQRGRFQYQRSTVQNHSLSKFKMNIFTSEKTKIKIKEAGNGPFKKRATHKVE